MKRPGLATVPRVPGRTRSFRSQRGSSMIEFAIVGPIVTLLGLAVLQYGLLFYAKNQINYASFMAVRAGSTGNAKLETIQTAYVKALIPMYGGGRNATELNASYGKAVADTTGNLQIQLINPTKESFDDWNDTALQSKYGARAIPNGGQAFKNAAEIKSNSGQNIQDANLLKIRVTHGYQPKVPLMAQLYTKYLQWLDPKTDSFHTQLVNAGRIPIITNVTVQMQSDAIEGDNISSPGMGNNGAPVNPGDPPAVETDAPECLNTSCSETAASGTTGTNGGGAGSGTGSSTGSTSTSCTASTTTQSLPSDLMFDFGTSTISASGKTQLDQLIANAQKQSFSAVALNGYTDQLGNATLNNQLSLNRATAVRDYLRSHGFPNKPITVKGSGSADPKVSLDACPASGQAQIDCLAPNRRVEITFSS